PDLPLRPPARPGGSGRPWDRHQVSLHPGARRGPRDEARRRRGKGLPGVRRDRRRSGAAPRPDRSLSGRCDPPSPVDPDHRAGRPDRFPARPMIALAPLSLDTRPLMARFLHTEAATISAYSFPAHFLWRDHFSFHWAIYREHFLLFARYDRCIYMPLPPLGPPDRQVVLDCFALMDRENPDRAVSRIENIAEADAGFYREAGFSVAPKDPEYLYRRAALADLKGDKHKSHRAACNRFEKEHRPVGRPYASGDAAAAWGLFQKWSADRAARH